MGNLDISENSTRLKGSRPSPKKTILATESWSVRDLRFMDMAFDEARKVKGQTRPNPPVGAVLVKAGKVIAVGGSQLAGQAHAEIVALQKAGTTARGSTLYVTLEPCCHYGKTPPCTLAVIAAGVREVVISAKDENPLVGGRGIKALRKAGIQVRIGIRLDVGEAFYRGFFFYIAQGRPLILLKIAQSLDGKVNAGPGLETSITGEETRAWVHALRSHVDAVLVGGNTVRIDDPDLTPRLISGAIPDALILNGERSLPSKAKLFSKSRKPKTVVLTESSAELPMGVSRVELPSSSPKQRDARTIAALLALFKERGYHSVLVEGGPKIWALFLKAGLWDSLYIVTAPIVLSQGEAWEVNLPRDWGNSLKFRNFASFGKDFMTDFGNSKIHG